MGISLPPGQSSRDGISCHFLDMLVVTWSVMDVGLSTSSLSLEHLVVILLERLVDLLAITLLIMQNLG